MVHTVMYLYYALAALGQWMRPYLWWKKYLTQLQLVGAQREIRVRACMTASFVLKPQIMMYSCPSFTIGKMCSCAFVCAYHAHMPTTSKVQQM